MNYESAIMCIIASESTCVCDDGAIVTIDNSELRIYWSDYTESQVENLKQVLEVA